MTEIAIARPLPRSRGAARAAAIVAVAQLGGLGAGSAATPADVSALSPDLRPGRTLSDVFSISQSVQAPGFDVSVRRNGGSGDYRFDGRNADGALRFDARFLYDGHPASSGSVLIADGGRTACWNGACQPVTDASGLLYDPLFWGAARGRLARGVSWKVAIAHPWELGPPGEETVTVLAVDPAHGSVSLERRGEGSGAWSSGSGTLKLVAGGRTVEFAVEPGRTRWRGVVTFRRGVVVSDELLVERVDRISSPETGPLKTTRRSIMLLQAAPWPTIAP